MNSPSFEEWKNEEIDPKGCGVYRSREYWANLDALRAIDLEQIVTKDWYEKFLAQIAEEPTLRVFSQSYTKSKA